MAVMDKNIKVSTHVDYPTEKDRPRGAGLNLVASPVTCVSESPDARPLEFALGREAGL
jgi:hypothetical protein